MCDLPETGPTLKSPLEEGTERLHQVPKAHHRHDLIQVPLILEFETKEQEIPKMNRHQAKSQLNFAKIAPGPVL